MTTALDGLRVLDISEGLAAPFAAKLLGDLGADVIKLEPPEGDSARRRGPFAGSEDIEASAPFLYANTSKRSVVIDPGNADDLALRARLLAQADVVISHETEPSLAARGLGYQDLAAGNPRVVLTTVTGFGSDGPYADWQWNHLIAGALGGFTYLCGREQREPLQLGASVTETLTGAYAAVAALIAVRGALEYGRGDHVDVSVIETAVNAALLPVQRYDYTGNSGERRADIGPSPSFILPTSDGLRRGEHADAGAVGDDVPVLRATGPGRRSAIRRRLVADGQLSRSGRRTGGTHQGTDSRRCLPRCSDVADPVRPDSDAVGCGQPAASSGAGVFLRLRASARRPGADARCSLDVRRRAAGGDSRTPLLGEHTEEVRAEVWGVALTPTPRIKCGAGFSLWERERPCGGPDGRLEGLRVIDLSMFMSGPMTSLVFADGGADVIKVESVQRIDGWRAGGATDDFWWEWAPQFNWVNRNKHGITLNLTDRARLRCDPAHGSGC